MAITTRLHGCREHKRTTTKHEGHSHLTTAAGVILKKVRTVLDVIITDNGSQKTMQYSVAVWASSLWGSWMGHAPFFSPSQPPERPSKLAHRLTIQWLKTFLKEYSTSYLSIWLLAVLGSPTIQMLISPLRFVFSVVTLGTPPNNMRRTPRLTSSFPAKRKSCLRAMIFRQRIERNGLYAPGKFTAELKKDNTNNYHYLAALSQDFKLLGKYNK